MIYTGHWQLRSFPTKLLLPHRETVVLNALRTKPLNAYGIWTKALKARPPLDWDEVGQALHDLEKAGHIIRVKETE